LETHVNIAKHKIAITTQMMSFTSFSLYNQHLYERHRLNQ